MQATPASSVRWTIDDLELFAGDRSRRYEIIDGELFVTRAPHWKHQTTCVNLAAQLKLWSDQSGLGQTSITPGMIFSPSDNVIPDLVWISNQRLEDCLDQSGHLTAAPELVVEVLSFGESHEKRDREAKLKLYSAQGVQEYWIVNWKTQSMEIYRREQGVLKLTATLYAQDELSSPLLPGFSCLVSQLF